MSVDESFILGTSIITFPYFHFVLLFPMILTTFNNIDN